MESSASLAKGANRFAALTQKTNFTSFEDADNLIEEHIEKFFKPFLKCTVKEGASLEVLKPQAPKPKKFSDEQQATPGDDYLDIPGMDRASEVIQPKKQKQEEEKKGAGRGKTGGEHVSLD